MTANLPEYIENNEASAGATLVEYALMVALMAVALIAVVTTLQVALSESLSNF